MSATNEVAIPNAVQGVDSVAPEFKDRYCPVCETTFSKTGGLRRHWRRPVPCQADGCHKSFRYDKFTSYRHHCGQRHSTGGVPLFDAGQLKNWFDGKVKEFKNVIDPSYCSGKSDHSLRAEPLAINMMSNDEYANTNGIDAFPHSQSEAQRGLGEGGDSHTNGSSLSPAARLDNVSSLFSPIDNSDPAALNQGQQTNWDRSTNDPQYWGMDFGLDSATRPMRRANPGEREWLLAQINFRKVEYYDLDHNNDALFDLLIIDPQFDTNSNISNNKERKEQLEVEIAIFQEEYDLLF